MVLDAVAVGPVLRTCLQTPQGCWPVLLWCLHMKPKAQGLIPQPKDFWKPFISFLGHVLFKDSRTLTEALLFKSSAQESGMFSGQGGWRRRQIPRIASLVYILRHDCGTMLCHDRKCGPSRGFTGTQEEDAK